MGTILEKAQQLVHGDRQQDYDSPLHNHERVALMVSAIIGMPITPHQAALIMEAVKLARESFKPKVDNRIDGAGYWLVADEILQAEAAGEVTPLSCFWGREAGPMPPASIFPENFTQMVQQQLRKQREQDDATTCGLLCEKHRLPYQIRNGGDEDYAVCDKGCYMSFASGDCHA